MAGLTVTEKEHWKERIARRIDKRIEVILAEEPNLHERIQRDARQQTLVSLGLAELQAELDAIERQKDDLQKRERQVKKAMLAQVRGVAVDEIDEYYLHRHDCEVEQAVARRQAVHEEELLAQADRGRKILRLRAEKDNLLDTVWLATSPAQMKQLWSKVAELLGDEPTQLARDALAMEPVHPVIDSLLLQYVMLALDISRFRAPAWPALIMLQTGLF